MEAHRHEPHLSEAAEKQEVRSDAMEVRQDLQGGIERKVQNGLSQTDEARCDSEEGAFEHP